MVASLEALKAFDRAVAPMQNAEHLARRTELLETVGERVYFMLIQREAMKLSCIEKFFEDYEIPAEVQARLAPRPRK